MKLKDLAKFHRQHGPKRPLSDFYKTAGFRHARDTLKALGYEDKAIIVRGEAHRHQPATAYVHTVVFMEYLRWANYTLYCKALMIQQGASDGDSGNDTT